MVMMEALHMMRDDETLDMLNMYFVYVETCILTLFFASIFVLFVDYGLLFCHFIKKTDSKQHLTSKDISISFMCF